MFSRSLGRAEGGRGTDKKVKKLLSIKQKPAHFRSPEQWHNDTSPQINEVFRPRRKGSPALLELGMTMSFQTQGARAAKLKSMKLQASKWETIFPTTTDILVVTPYHPPAPDCTVWSAAAPSWTDKLTLSKLIVTESHSEGLTDLFVNPRRAIISWQHWRFWPRYLLTRIWIINFKLWEEY